MNKQQASIIAGAANLWSRFLEWVTAIGRWSSLSGVVQMCHVFVGCAKKRVARRTHAAQRYGRRPVEVDVGTGARRPSAAFAHLTKNVPPRSEQSVFSLPA